LEGLRILFQAVKPSNLLFPAMTLTLTILLGAGIFAAMLFDTTWKVLSGQGVTWKGREYTSHTRK
jgi:hypothetical protein